MTARPPNVIGNWWLGENLGSGYSGVSQGTYNFLHVYNMHIGSIWRAQNIHNGEVVALKVQDVDHECPTNRYERAFYPSLQGGKGMPTLWAAGVEGKWDYLAIDLLGSSLDSLYRKSGKEMMDLRSTCCIAMQVVCRNFFLLSSSSQMYPDSAAGVHAFSRYPSSRYPAR